jgi:O-antigen/teichoic acid export membrane protein
VCAFFEVIANPGLTTHAMQQVAAHRKDAAPLVSDILALRGLSVLIAILALLVLSAFETRPDVRRLLLGYGVGVLFIGLVGADFLLSSLELFHVRSALTLAQQALYAAGVLTLVRTPKDIFWLPASILGSSLATSLVGWLILWRTGFRLPLAVNPDRWRAILVPSLHYAATTAMATVYHRTGHLVVRWFLGDYALGLYAAAVRFVDLLRNFVSIALNVLMPRMALAAQSRAGMKRLVQAAVSAVAAVSIPLTLGTLATANLVVPWILGKSYADAIRLVRLLSPLSLAAPVASLFAGTVLYAMGRHRAYLVSSAVGALTAVVFSFGLVRVAGLPGVCIAFVLAEAAVGVAAYLQIPSELRDVWKNPMIIVAGFAGLAMMAVVKLVNSYSSRPLVVVISGAAMYLIVLFASGRTVLREQFGDAR